MDKQISLTQIISRFLAQKDLRQYKLFRLMLEVAKEWLSANSTSICLPTLGDEKWVTAYWSEAGEAYRGGNKYPLHGEGHFSVAVDGVESDASIGLVMRPSLDQIVLRIPLRRNRIPYLLLLAHLDSDNPNLYGPADEALNLFAQMCSLALENALRDEHQFFLQKAAMIYASEEASRVGDLAKEIAERTRFEACTIFTVTKDTSDLRVVGTTGLLTDLKREAWLFDPNKAIGDPAARVMQLREPVVSNHLQEEQWYGHESLPDDVESARQQILAAPVFSQSGELVGVLRLRNKRIESGDVPVRLMDSLDLVEAELIADAISPMLDVVETELVRAEAIASMRHSMRDPIVSIRNVAGKFAEQGVGFIQQRPEIVHQRLEDIALFCDLLFAHIDRSRVLSYQDVKFDFEKVDLRRDVVAKLISLLGHEREEHGIKGISLGNFTGFSSLYLDKHMMYVVFYNLFENAIKYSARNTAINVESACERDWYLVNVSNYGDEIREEDKELIFRKWYRTKTAVKGIKGGLGLGLYHVRKIIERHGGNVELTNLANPTTITIRLPRSLIKQKPGDKIDR